MKLKAALPVVAMAMSMTQISAAAQVPSRSVEAVGVRFEWRIEDAQLRGCMQAATQGWVTVGFNTKPTLDGARLVMGRVVNGRAEAQVHIAKPPQHIHRFTPQGAERVSQVTGTQDRSLTRICFQMPLAAFDQEDVALRAGQDTHIVLAWSRERDFEHHSAERSAVQVKL